MLVAAPGQQEMTATSRQPRTQPGVATRCGFHTHAQQYLLCILTCKSDWSSGLVVFKRNATDDAPPDPDGRMSTQTAAGDTIPTSTPSFEPAISTVSRRAALNSRSYTSSGTSSNHGPIALRAASLEGDVDAVIPCVFGSHARGLTSDAENVVAHNAFRLVNLAEAAVRTVQDGPGLSEGHAMKVGH